MTLNEFRNRVRNLDANVTAKGAEILKPASGYMIAIQKQRILSGKTHTGEDIQYNKPRVNTPSSAAYTRRYVKFKEKRGGQTSHVDLKLDGKFLNSMAAMAENEAFVITFSDGNTGKVQGIFSNYDNLIGITEEETIDLNELIKPNLIDQIQNSLIKL